MTKQKVARPFILGLCVVAALFLYTVSFEPLPIPSYYQDAAAIPKNSSLSSLQQRPATPAFVYVFKTSGMGSQLLNFFAQVVYFREQQGRHYMVADESTYPYRYNSTVGFLTAYFTPQFPVIDTVEQQQEWVQPYFPNHNYTTWRMQSAETGVRKTEKKWKGNPEPSNDTAVAPIIITSLFAVRNRILETYNRTSVELYKKIVNAACPHLQFNAATLARMTTLQQEREIPVADFRDTAVAAFHVRRGDKLKNESRLYPGKVYLQRLQKKVTPPGRTFEHCFVATDTYSAYTEIRDALERDNWKTCRNLWTLTEPSEKGFNYKTQQHSDASTLLFLTELKILVDADYFVGTFNSNVGGLAAVLRGCHRRELLDDSYAHSYGVDLPYWYFR